MFVEIICDACRVWHCSMAIERKGLPEVKPSIVPRLCGEVDLPRIHRHNIRAQALLVIVF